MDYQETGGFDSLQRENNYKTLKSELEKAFRQAKTAPTPRDAKDILIKAQGKFKEFKLKPEHREELYQGLQDEFQKVNERINSEKNQYEQEAYFNYRELKLKVDEAVYQSGKQEDWREAKKYLIEAQSAFKGLRLIREQREELFNKIQKAFEEINLRSERENLTFQQESFENHQRLKPLIENLFLEASNGENINEIRDKLIQLQSEFKGIRLEKEKRETLYSRLQSAFDTLNQRIGEAREKNLEIAEQNFEFFLKEVSEVKQEAESGTTFKEIRDRIRNLQADLRDSILLREQKDQLYSSLQESFQLINNRQDQERSEFENEAVSNFKRLSKLVADGLAQAQESNEYRETREFLKKIQGEFKGIRMIKEQREELYSRLQSAFSILRERTDTYFREKQKNWEVKMEFRLKDLSVHILELQMIIAKEKEKLEELETQLDILEQKPVDSPAKLMVMAQIQSLHASIHKNEKLIEETRLEKEELELRLGEQPNS
ncbi:MAG: hypothetical protein AB9842_13340 [Bacteroidales bacterium]